MCNERVALAVPAIHVKTVKTALESKGQLNRTGKITPEKENNGLRRMVINTTILHNSTEPDQDKTSEKDALLSALGVQHLSDKISLIVSSYSPEDETPTYRNPLLKALKDALDATPEAVLSGLELSSSNLVSSFPESHTVYKPMLLLSHNAFSSKSWTKFLASYSIDSKTLLPVWKKVAEGVGVTHIAINAGIPLKTQSAISENVFRSPVNLTPVYGDFGPHPTAERISNPTESDFANAFWVRHTQNGIHQTWAPLYTMFSRGNIREKARLLTLPSVLQSIEEGKDRDIISGRAISSNTGCAAADLYAGIGYFTFSYKKAGMSKVVCWELNPWSVEGLRRGAKLNRWTTQIFKDFPRTEDGWTDWLKVVKDVDLLVFQQSNEFALPAIKAMNQSYLPPIRHVNLGLLPKSNLSWPTAVRIIDQALGGWIHAHENVGVNDIDKRKVKVEKEFQDHLDTWKSERGQSTHSGAVRVEHVEQVKTFAPGVVHIVIDVQIDGVEGT